MRYRAAVCLLMFLIVPAVSVSAQGVARALPPGEGRDLVTVACSQCHGLGTIAAMRDGPAGWKIDVYDMILRGAQLNAREADTVLRYLTDKLGPTTAPAGADGKASPALPEGPGMNVVASKCAMCHDLERVTAVKRKTSDWDAVLADMKTRGAQLTPDEIQQVARYLLARFGMN